MNIRNPENLHTSLCNPRIVYSHFQQILSFPFVWLVWDIYVPLTSGRVGKLNFRMQEIALLVQKVTKYNQLSVTSRGLSGLWISCASRKGNLLHDTVTKSSTELSLLSHHGHRAPDPAGNSAQKVFQPNLIFIFSSVSCTFLLTPLPWEIKNWVVLVQIWGQSDKRPNKKISLKRIMSHHKPCVQY